MSNSDILEFSQRLNHALDLRGYPSLGRGRINYVQEIFAISRAGANKWLHGKAIPHPRKRAEIASKLNISLTWLETGKGTPSDTDNTRFTSEYAAHTIPLLTLEQAYNHQAIIGRIATDKLIVNNSIPKNAFAVTCVGAAMEPKFSQGSILIIDLDISVRDGDYVLARTNLLPEAIFRQYIKGSGGGYLVAINPRFESTKIDEMTSIIGKVIEVRSML